MATQPIEVEPRQRKKQMKSFKITCKKCGVASEASGVLIVCPSCGAVDWQ